MKGLDFSKEKREVPLSHYKIMRSHLIAKSTFKDENHIDTVKPGTLLGFPKMDIGILKILNTITW